MTEQTSSLNEHKPGCGPFTPKECCHLASMVMTEDPATFDHLSTHFAAKAKVKERRQSLQQPVERVAKKAKRKTKKKVGRVIGSSLIWKLAGMRPSIGGALADAKLTKVGQVEKLGAAGLVKTGFTEPQVKELQKLFTANGRELS